MIDAKRNLGIDLLKFMAALLVVNSHIDIMYGKYSALATGGSIGDILFFFCSGFTLFMKPIGKGRPGGVICSFPDWYKRRINRIWPSLIVVALIKCWLFDSNKTIAQAFFYHGYWFIDCIMLYYIVIYLIGAYWKWDYKWIYVAVSVATFIWFYMIDKPEGYTMYHPGSIIKWLPYFLLMLMGAQLGRVSVNKKNVKMHNSWLYLFLFFVYAAIYYLIYGLSTRYSSLQWIQPFSFIPLIPCIYNIYKFACHPSMDAFIRRWYWIIATIGGLCLEIYLVHYFFITDRYNEYLPLNILAMLLLSLIFAYVLRCGSRFFAQTFKDAPYDWKAIIKLY